MLELGHSKHKIKNCILIGHTGWKTCRIRPNTQVKGQTVLNLVDACMSLIICFQHKIIWVFYVFGWIVNIIVSLFDCFLLCHTSGLFFLFFSTWHQMFISSVYKAVSLFPSLFSSLPSLPPCISPTLPASLPQAVCLVSQSNWRWQGQREREREGGTEGGHITVSPGATQQ